MTMLNKVIVCALFLCACLGIGSACQAVIAGDWRAKTDWDYDGKRILGHIGNDVCLWDATDGRLVKKFVGHTEKIVFAQFGPDGRYALNSSGWVPEDMLVPNSAIHLVSKDTSTRLWDLDTGKQLYCLTNRIAAGVDPTGKLIITYSEAGKGSNRFEADIWEMFTGRLISKCLLDSYFSPQSSSLKFSPDGQSYIFFGGGTIVVRDTSNGQEITRFRTMDDYFVFVAPNAFLGIGSDEATVWNLKTGQISRRFKDPFKGRSPIASTSDGRKFIGVVPKFFTIETDSGRVKQGSMLESGSSPVIAWLLSPDGKTFVIEWPNKDGCSGTADLFDVNSCQKMATVDLGNWGHIIAFSPDGSTLLTGGSSFRIYASKDGKLLHQFNLLGNEVRSYMWSNRG